MKKVVIYPGRFQPMLPHHAEVYKKLQAQFPGADVYVATSDKVEMPKSPFNFKEKVAIMTQLHDIPANRIIQAKSPYLVDSYTKSFDQENTMVIFAVGAKDEDRFPMNNVDPNTGLDMTVRGEPRPKFYQMINTLKQHPALPMSERGYIYHAPIVDKDGEVASASAFRNAFANAVDVEQQKEVFTKYMGKFDNGVFELLKNKMDNTMKEELNNLKFLAGLLSEAPMSWDSEPEDDEEDFKPGFTQDNMVNQLGKIADSEEASKDAEAMKVKKFKVADTVITDDGKKFKLSGAEARALIKMFNMLSSQRAGEEESPREKFNRSIQQSKGLQNMLDFAKAKGLVQEDASEMPTVNFDDMRSEYGIEEGDGEEHFCQACNGSGCEQCDNTGVDAHFRRQEESAPFGEPSQQDMMADELNDAYEKGGEEELAKAMGLSIEELDQEMTEFAMDHNLHMDDDRDEVIHGYIAQVVDNADFKDHGEYESIEEDEKDSWTGSTKDGHKYKAVADDQDGSQYLKVFYGDGKYFKIYYDSNHIGGKAGGYDHTQVAPETNDPRAEKVFADLPDDFFDKYGSEGETGLEDIIDMIKSVDEVVEEGVGEYSYTLEYNGEENGYAKHKLTITSPEGETKEVADDFTYFDVEGDELQAELESWFHKGMGVADASVDEAVDSTINNAFDAAIQELRTLSGLNS